MRILLISHNALTTFDAMGKTLLSLLSGFNKEELSHFFIYPSRPGVDVCSSCYRITDKEVLKFYYTFKVVGERVLPDLNTDSIFENSKDELFYRNPRNGYPLARLLRDIMWKMSRWYNKDLKCWIREQSPNCLFVAPGPASFLYDIAMTISKDFNIPIVSYLCDEYYFVKKPCGLISIIQHKLLKRKIEQYMSFVSHIISISDELKFLYSEFFKKPVTTIMTGASFPISNRIFDNRTGIISFYGNVRCNRFVSLVEIGKELEKINKTELTNYILEIHTSEKNHEIISALNSVSTIRLCDFVMGEKYVESIRGSDYLLHVEAFDENSIDFVKNSISTKIADSLASGVPLIAYGPERIASINHLQRNKCAFIISDKDSLNYSLRKIFFNPSEKENVVKKALSVATEFHNQTINENKVKSIFYSIVMK